MINKAQLLGHVGQDIEIKINNDNKFAVFSLATSDRYKDKVTHEYKSVTEWHKIVVFSERLVNLCEKYLKKGSKIYLEGKLTTTKYTKDGVDKYSTAVKLDNFNGNIVLLDSKDDIATTNGVMSEILHDEIPF